VSALNNAISEQPATSQAAGVWIVFRFQHESRSFVASEIHGAWSGPARTALSFRMGEERGLVGWIGARAQPLWLPNLKEETRWSGLDDALHSAYLTPIARQEEMLGVLLVGSRRAGGLDALHRSLADGVASELAQSWSNARPEGVSSEVPSAGTDLSSLSQRERDVVNALCRGLRLSDIAKVLGISNHTARNHLKHVFRKLGVHSQVELLSMIGRRTGIPDAIH
jgi:DNA-binding CsgD family transcriptional regulator